MKFARPLTILTTLLFATVSAYAEEKTYAEKLGWEKGDKVVILHIDDAGMSHESNVGTIKAMEEGVANSFSVMMPCPWVPEIVDYIKENPNVDAGLHLTLTSEWDDYRWPPLVGKPAAPGLVDEEGCLWDNVPLVIQNASPDEVEAEVRAQIDRARAMGFEPTHLDSHMGTLFYHPAFFERYIKVGIETDIPVMLPGGHLSRARVENPNLDRGPIIQAAKMVWEAGLPVLDDLHNSSYGWKTEDKTEQYIDALKNLEPGLTMVIMHCTERTPNFDKISSSGVTRQGDLNAMVDPKLRKFIEDEGIILTTFREIKRRRDALDE